MEFTQEQIDALAVDEVAVMRRIADELGVRVPQVSAVVSLVAEGCTIPFISRYRKEAHGGLDEVQVRDSDRLFKSYTNLEARRLEIVRGIFAQGKLTESLHAAAMSARTLAELEDLWAPFKKKKRTRGMIAIERGLDSLADAMLTLDKAALEAKAAEYVRGDEENPELSVATAADALSGAQDIVAERTAQDSGNRADVRGFYLRTGKIVVKGIGGEEEARTSVYQMYWDYEEQLSQIKPHRVLAINRGEREGKLEVRLDVDVDGAIELLRRKCTISNSYHADAIEDALVRLLSPAVLREIRGDQSERADEHGIGVFSENLKNLLMRRPIKGTRVLGVDPGIRTGTKCAALDETGKFLGDFVVKQVADPDGAAEAIGRAIRRHNIQLVAVGNGTGTREVQAVVARVIGELAGEGFAEVRYTVVDEDGASVYSASDTAREEFPGLDLTIRGAISIGRRLQDPLAELVKIDPKAIGVGLYQHDVNQKKLSEKLDEVVGSVVNNVGVNLNTASSSLLKYVSGINSSLAKKIVAYRDEHGKISSRRELMEVGGMGEKTFEQCAGFLKIPESAEELDNTWVHPENYAAAREVLPLVRQKADVPAGVKKELGEKYGIGERTVTDIIEELRKPNRDPRDGYPAPIMQKGVVSFDDLKEGMKVTGKVKNVVDFGAFVDLGLKETALVHISELSDNFVSDPMDVVKVGDVRECTIIGLDEDRRRISLSLKSDAAVRIGQGKGRTEGEATGDGGSGGARKVARAVRMGAGGNARQGHDANRKARPADGRGERNSGGSRDGTSYNPFATLLKDRR